VPNKALKDLFLAIRMSEIVHFISLFKLKWSLWKWPLCNSTNRYSSSIKNSDQHRKIAVKLCAFSWFSSGCKSTRKDSHQKIFFKLWGSLESSPTFNKPTERKFVIGHYIAMFVVLFYSDLDCCTRRKCFFFF
jgi:hypothetical protein